MLPNEGSVVKSDKTSPNKCTDGSDADNHKTKLLRNKNDLRLTISVAHQIPNNDPHRIYCANCQWVCNFLNVWSLYAGEPLISHWHHHILYQASLSVLHMNPFLLHLSWWTSQPLVDCSWGPSFKINVILQGRAAQRQSSLSLFEMIIGPCGITDAGEVGGTDGGTDAKRQKYMWIVRQIDAK